jgi:hypothetical protein
MAANGLNVPILTSDELTSRDAPVNAIPKEKVEKNYVQNVT